ncbi:hypothetical protein SOV_50330 [Sporomusa ovata DSM 2662]|nr:hypothetical protein [Sporomusa ovata]EQB27406.1 hypothetical protein SOV_2c03020 [Sporomusa ovata DSM 2662]
MIVLKQCLEVGICGNSLFLNGMAASLQEQRLFRVSRLEKSLADAVLDIKMLSPHAVLFEYTDAERPIIAALLRECPGIRLIGLEAERNSLIVFSGSEHAVTNVEELIQVIVDKQVSK